MARELKGTRYLTAANERLKEAILTELPYMDFYETLRFYRSVEPHLDDKGRALLNCNDRYYLITVTCHRQDAWHPWIFERCREVRLVDFRFRPLGQRLLELIAYRLRKFL